MYSPFFETIIIERNHFVNQSQIGFQSCVCCRCSFDVTPDQTLLEFLSCICCLGNFTLRPTNCKKRSPDINAVSVDTFPFGKALSGIIVTANHRSQSKNIAEVRTQQKSKLCLKIRVFSTISAIFGIIILLYSVSERLNKRI